MKKIIIIVVVVALLLVGTVAFASSLTDEQKEFFNFKKDRVNYMVENGKITQEQANEYLANVEQRLLDGTCDGTGENCENGEDCEFGLNKDGECLGFGQGSRNCGQFAGDDSQQGIGNGFCGGRGTGAGCGR